MKITFIQTGGTIDKDYPKSSGGWAFEIQDPAVERTLERLNPNFEYEVITAFRKDSLEITTSDRAELIRLIEELDTNKVIITHGTDTMIETAKELAAVEHKTIVITGAMRPERFSNSDADVNIGMALATLQTNSNGVFVCMHGLVLSLEELDRNMETGQYQRKPVNS